ncbi:hypothetical protein BDP81DRAFT_418742 [Colletotrichum phormii]|uniref:Uncharacterized protein n=1 Tax=Colletotrichum phormii TaxID=359342 RepID=A0AAJ0EIA1_9PEZI|nr:uncharacterized protein BDP81DRAFT_418742 [Colletotrichum phormii]KAK1641362.1 hypothetical protein BDP81DRAFT_418742 [Colletotrichum phormii]
MALIGSEDWSEELEFHNEDQSLYAQLVGARREHWTMASFRQYLTILEGQDVVATLLFPSPGDLGKCLDRLARLVCSENALQGEAWIALEDTSLGSEDPVCSALVWLSAGNGSGWKPDLVREVSGRLADWGGTCYVEVVPSGGTLAWLDEREDALTKAHKHLDDVGNWLLWCNACWMRLSLHGEGGDRSITEQCPAYRNQSCNGGRETGIGTE